MEMDKQLEQAKSLPIDRKDEWIMERRQVNLPIAELGDNVFPHLLICIASDAGIIDTKLIPPDAPDSEALSWALGCMLSPKQGWPRRPKSILLAGGGLEALRPALIQTGVEVHVQPKPHPVIDGIVSLMVETLTGKGLHPYLVETDLDPDTVADFFRAAADFYRLRPWKYFPYEIPIKVTLRLKRRKNYWATVMGVGGQELGLSLLRSAADMEALLYGTDTVDDSVVMNMHGFGFSFEDVGEIGGMARSEYRANEWPLAAKSAYPHVIVYDRTDEEGLRRPNKKEIEDLIAVTRAITQFCQTYRRQIEEAGDDIEIVEDTFTVPVLNRQIEVSIEFPAPEFLE